MSFYTPLGSLRREKKKINIYTCKLAMHCNQTTWEAYYTWLGYVECWASSHMCLPYFQQENSTELVLEPRGRVTAPQHYETSAWSHKASWMVDYKWHLKSKKSKTESKITYRNAVLVYSSRAQFSGHFQSLLFSKSKVDRTDAAASVTDEWATCFPRQVLPEW